MDNHQIRVFFRDFRKDPVSFTKLEYAFPDAEAELRRRCFIRLEEKYGKNPPKQICDRLEHELSCLTAEYWSHATYYCLIATLLEYCDSLGGLHSLRICGGNSFAAYLLGFSDINPLPPHKYCPACGHVEFVDAAKCVSGFDLFCNEHETEHCPFCSAVLSGDGHNLDSNFFMGEDGTPLQNFDCTVSEEVFHPMYDFLMALGNVQENLTEAEANASFQYLIMLRSSHSLTALKKLEKHTGVSARSIPIERGLISDFIESSETLPYIGKDAYIILQGNHPSSFSELVKTVGLGKGTGTWKQNAENLIATDCNIKDVIAHRDDILQTLMCYGVDRRTSIKLSHATRKGRAKGALTPEIVSLLQEKGVPEWYISSMKKIEYLSSRAYTTDLCIQALRLTWYEMHFPKEFFDLICTGFWGLF